MKAFIEFIQANTVGYQSCLRTRLYPFRPTSDREPVFSIEVPSLLCRDISDIPPFRFSNDLLYWWVLKTINPNAGIQ